MPHSTLNATTAMFAAVVAGILLKDEPLTPKKIVGAALGIAGVAFIMGPSALTEFNLGNLAQLAILGATLSYAFAGVWGRTALSGQPPLVNALGMLVGSTVLMIPIAMIENGTPSFNLSAGVWGALLGMAALSTALAYVLPHSTLKCNTSGGGDRFSGRMMLRIGQEAATVPLLKRRRLPCPRATAT